MLLESRIGAVPQFIAHQHSNAHVAAYWSSQCDVPPVPAFQRALNTLGKDINGITLADRDYLSTLDEFHCLGVEATRDMAQLLRVIPRSHVLDLGCGLGGPARRLATEYACRVTGVDITKDFLLIAHDINKRMGLTDQIKLRREDITRTSFEEESYDLAWMQVAAANIRERDELYRAVRAALRPEALFGIFDIFCNDEALIRYPVPWGVNRSTSALLSYSDTVSALERAGFRVTKFCDVSKRACKWFEAEVDFASVTSPPARLDFSVLLKSWPVIARNQVENLQSGAIMFGYLVAQKI